MKESSHVSLNKWFRVSLVVCLVALASAISVRAQDDDVISAAPAGSKVKFTHVGPPTSKNGMAHARFGIPNIDSVPNFNGQYFTAGQDPNGNPQNHWYFYNFGNPPPMGRNNASDPTI